MADRALHDVGVARQRRIELAHHVRRRALLRAEHRARALRPEQRIAYVARDVDRRTDEPRIGLAVDAREACERRAALGEVAPVAIEEAIAEGARHPCPAVLGRTSTDSHDDAVR